MGKPNNPVVGMPGRSFELGHIEGVEGLTIRQYFMAHAPAEPQEWFEPAMSPRPPAPPNRYTELDQKQREMLEFGGNDPKVEDFRQRHAAAIKECEAWELERLRRRAVEWPAAWADAVLAAGEK